MLALVQAYEERIMALALETYVSVNFELMDSLGKKTTRTVEMSNADSATETIGELVARAVSFWTEFDTLTLSALTNMSITLNYRESSVTVPGAGLNADNAEIALPLANRPNVYGIFSVPAPASAIFVAATGANANVVDPSNADVQALMGKFAASDDFYISDREKMIAFSEALFRGKRAQRNSR